MFYNEPSKLKGMAFGVLVLEDQKEQALHKGDTTCNNN